MDPVAGAKAREAASEVEGEGGLEGRGMGFGGGMAGKGREPGMSQLGRELGAEKQSLKGGSAVTWVDSPF